VIVKVWEPLVCTIAVQVLNSYRLAAFSGGLRFFRGVHERNNMCITVTQSFKKTFIIFFYFMLILGNSFAPPPSPANAALSTSNRVCLVYEPRCYVVALCCVRETTPWVEQQNVRSN
jgi:hypothetical protein